MISKIKFTEIKKRDCNDCRHVSCMALRTLCFESIENQDKVANEGGIEPLLHLLRSLRTSDRVLSMCMRTLISLCIGVAHTNNPFTQRKIVEENTLSFLVQLLKNPPTTDIQIQVRVSNFCDLKLVTNSDNSLLFRLRMQLLRLCLTIRGTRIF